MRNNAIHIASSTSETVRGGGYAVKCLLLLLALLCSSAVMAADYHFRPIDKEFDRIASQLYSLDYNNQRDKADPKLLDCLDAIARSARISSSRRGLCFGGCVWDSSALCQKSALPC